MPSDHVAESVTLGYASTAMAGQGRSVDPLVLVDGPIGAAGLYVPMTGGRDGNDVWVVTDPDSPFDGGQSDKGDLTRAISRVARPPGLMPTG